jgi:hypothetical protein
VVLTQVYQRNRFNRRTLPVVFDECLNSYNLLEDCHGLGYAAPIGTWCNEKEILNDIVGRDFLPWIRLFHVVLNPDKYGVDVRKKLRT